MVVVEDINDEQEIQIIREEVEAAIKRLKVGKAPSNDNTTPEIIKYMRRGGKNKLTKIMNKVLKKKEIHKDWKTDIILPIYKRGNTRDS